MTTEEKIREIMLSEELQDSEKLDRFARPHTGRRAQNRQLEQGDARPTQAIKRSDGSQRSNKQELRRRTTGNRPIV